MAFRVIVLQLGSGRTARIAMLALLAFGGALWSDTACFRGTTSAM